MICFCLSQAVVAVGLLIDEEAKGPDLEECGPCEWAR